MRISDSRTGQLAEVRAERGRMLKVLVHTADGGGPQGDGLPDRLGGLRALLVADVLLRTAELAGAQVLVGHAGGVPGAAAAGIHPAVLPAELGHRPADLWIVAPGAEPPAPRACVVLAVGPVRAPTALEDPRDGDEPRALRLVLLESRPEEPVPITTGRLQAARESLARRREQVARWAESPSRPAEAEAVRRIGAALDDGLDTGTVLAVLDALAEDPAVPAGAKFETFLFADRVLALELPSLIGRW